MKLHGHPQLAEYTDLSKCPNLGIHMNWGPGEHPVASPDGSDGVLDIVALRIGNSQLGHMHMNLLHPPLYAEIIEPFECKFSIVVFNAQGQAYLEPSYQQGIRNISWDTPTGKAPEMRADLGVEKTWTGTLVFDPTLAQDFRTLHGWWNPNFNATFRFDNSDAVDKVMYPCFFSLIDPNAPESKGVPFVSCRVSPHEKRHNESWGDQLVETLRGTPQWLPVAPLKAHEIYRFKVATNGYGAVVENLPLAIVELREGSNIHQHGAGNILQEKQGKGVINLDVALDADALGAGNHNVIIGRRQKGLFSDQAIVTQMTLGPIVVEGVPPPPPTTTTVPNVVGLSEMDAHMALMAAGLRPDVSTAEDAAPVGQVFRQVPDAGTTASLDSVVDVYVSSGPHEAAHGEVVATIEKRTIDGVVTYCVCVGEQCVVLP